MYKTLVLATKNRGKLKEFKKYFLDSEYNIKSIDEVMDDDGKVKETGKTFEENARIKALYFSGKTDYPIIGEDSGLSVNILNGYPGIYSARIGKTDMERIEKILSKLKDKTDKERKACFISVIALAFKNRIIKTFKGKVSGYITQEPMGYNGFGYDPIFYYRPLKKTFAEINPETKNLYSHRGRAIKKLIKFLDNNSILK